MENLKTFFGKFFAQIASVWGGLTFARRLIAGFATAIVLIGISSLWFLQEKDPWVYIVKQQDTQDTQGIIDYFKRTSFTEWKSDSTGIKVPPKHVQSLSAGLVMEGLPGKGRLVGLEIFDEQDFTRTEEERRILKLRALQGELARTIMRVEKIKSARVHIVKPRDRVFREDQKSPTAAVYLKADRDFNCDRRSVRGIVHLISRSVEGLKSRDITVIDSEGRLCTEPEPDDFTSKHTKQRLAYKKTLEKRYEESVRAIVGRVVGPDRVEVKIDAEVDFTQESQTVSDVDPDKVVVLGRQTTGYKLNGSGLNPTGIPGAKSNVPGEQEDATLVSSSGTTNNTKDSETVNYEVSKTISQRTMPVGNILKLSAAVLVDGKQVYQPDGSKPDFEPRTESEILMIEELVKSAIGFQEKRGDSVTVRNMMFQLDPFQIQTIQEEKQETREYVTTLAVSSAAAFALVMFFAFVVRPYFRWLSYDPERKQMQQTVEEYKPDLELGSLQNVQVKEDVPFEKLTPQEQVLFLAKNEPERTTEAIRLLLNPHQSA